MSLNSTPSGERVHIGFFGRRNAGKSSVVNAVTNQQISVVSDVRGTTTDPVTKAMELLPVGPVMIIDTPGFDDEGSLGEERVKRTKQVLNRADVAVLVVDASAGKTAADEELLAIFRQKNIPYLVAYNKSDLAGEREYADGIAVSALTRRNIDELKEAVARLAKTEDGGRRLCSDLVAPGDIAVLVVPIDKAAPKGRLILPQQQTIRDLLDAGAAALTVRDTELASLLGSLGVKPRLVITDSQAFAKVKDIVPGEIPLTSFSILMARYKGFLEPAVRGAAAIKYLRDGGQGLSRGSLALFAGDPLRRLYAQRARDALPSEVRAGLRDPVYQLRHRHRLHERHLKAYPQRVPRFAEDGEVKKLTVRSAFIQRSAESGQCGVDKTAAFSSSE